VTFELVGGDTKRLGLRILQSWHRLRLLSAPLSKKFLESYSNYAPYQHCSEFDKSRLHSLCSPLHFTNVYDCYDVTKQQELTDSLHNHVHFNPGNEHQPVYSILRRRDISYLERFKLDSPFHDTTQGIIPLTPQGDSCVFGVSAEVYSSALSDFSLQYGHR